MTNSVRNHPHPTQASPLTGEKYQRHGRLSRTDTRRVARPHSGRWAVVVAGLLLGCFVAIVLATLHAWPWWPWTQVLVFAGRIVLASAAVAVVVSIGLLLVARKL